MKSYHEMKMRMSVTDRRHKKTESKKSVRPTTCEANKDTKASEKITKLLEVYIFFSWRMARPAANYPLELQST